MEGEHTNPCKCFLQCTLSTHVPRDIITHSLDERGHHGIPCAGPVRVLNHILCGKCISMCGTDMTGVDFKVM